MKTIYFQNNFLSLEKQSYFSDNAFILFIVLLLLLLLLFLANQQIQLVKSTNSKFGYWYVKGTDVLSARYLKYQQIKILCLFLILLYY